MPEENWIRYNFNNFLDALENFSYYVEAGLVTKKDLEPYLNYWLNLLANPNNQMQRPIEFYQNLWKFIYHYNYLSIQKLCECFDYKISDIFELSDREELQRYYATENYSIGRYSSPTISTSLYF
ncbi:hypothetical protein HC928_15420 [bacterium]|nr:hypothetical protein [bacterium]